MGNGRYLESDYIDTLLVRVVREQQLLQEEEGPLVRDPLPHLYHSLPRPLRIRRLAVLALLVADGEGHHHSLLQNRVVHHLLLHSQLDFQAQAVRFRPNPHSIDKLHFVEAAYFTQARGHQFL